MPRKLVQPSAIDMNAFFLIHSRLNQITPVMMVENTLLKRTALMMFMVFALNEVSRAQSMGSASPAPVTSEHSSYLGGLLPLPAVLGLTGEGIDILVWDSGIPLMDHYAFDNASLVLAFNSENTPDNHATTVIGSVIGQGNCAFHPTAPEATVHAFDNVTGSDAWEIRFEQWENMLDSGVGEITNWSFLAGGGWVKTTIEQLTHAHPEHLLVLGAGNPGLAAWSTVANDHKNGLSVGSIDHNFNHSPGNSGRGPSNEGRIKPDLVDFGSQVVLPGIDATGAAAIRTMQGSSFACILTAGKAALIQQAANELFGNTLRGDMLKSILILTARDLGPTGPDFNFGFGQMQTDAGVEFIHRLHDNCSTSGTHLGQLPAGQSDTLEIEYSGEHAFRACLTWMDPPIGNNNHNILNNLDLSLRNEDDEVAYPWALPEAQTYLDNSSNLDLLYELPAVRQVNNMDNVELIDIDMMPGEHHRLVVTNNGPLGQFYALSWQELPPKPWSLPTSNVSPLSCAVDDVNLNVFTDSGDLMPDACNSLLSHGAYFIQELREDGCHHMKSFEVDCHSCPGDIDGDGTVGSADLMNLLALMEDTSVLCETSCLNYNLAGSMIVNIDDFLSFLGAFGSTCG